MADNYTPLPLDQNELWAENGVESLQTCYHRRGRSVPYFVFHVPRLHAPQHSHTVRHQVKRLVPLAQATLQRLHNNYNLAPTALRLSQKSTLYITVIMCGSDCFLMLLSVLFPPVGVWVKKGLCSADSLINLALCCLGFLPGLLHAWYVILQNPDPYDAYHQVPDRENGTASDGRTTYYVITHEQPAGRQANYGTVGSQPSNGQFPGQQSGVTNSFAQPKGHKATKGTSPANTSAPHGGGGSSSQPEGPPPTYAEVIKGDHKVQDP